MNLWNRLLVRGFHVLGATTERVSTVALQSFSLCFLAGSSLFNLFVTCFEYSIFFVGQMVSLNISCPVFFSFCYSCAVIPMLSNAVLNFVVPFMFANCFQYFGVDGH